MTLEDRIREAEGELFAAAGLDVQTSFLELPRTGVRVRVLGVGDGPPVLLLHGVTLAAAVWTPLLGELTGYRLLAVELPGHGLSGPVDYRPGHVRDHNLRQLDDLFEALDLASPPVVAHSLGAMFALWYAAARPQGIGSLAVVGDPAVALPGVTVRMPLSLMTVPVVGPLLLRGPTPRPLYRQMFGMGNGGAAAQAVPDRVLDVLRLAIRRPGNARTVGALMHALNGFRRPRPESVMSTEELGRVTVPTTFLWGTDDPYLGPQDGRPAIEAMPEATLHEVPGGHALWYDDLAGTAAVITRHLTATGSPPGTGGTTPPGP